MDIIGGGVCCFSPVKIGEWLDFGLLLQDVELGSDPPDEITCYGVDRVVLLKAIPSNSRDSFFSWNDLVPEVEGCRSDLTDHAWRKVHGRRTSHSFTITKTVDREFILLQTGVLRDTW